MVHDRDELELRIDEEGLHFLDHIRAGNLATQMQEMLGTRDVAGLCIGDSGGQLAHPRAEFLVVIVIADTQGVENRRDPRANDLRIMGEHRGQRRPFDARARHEMHFEMVGMKLHQARKQVIAGKVLPFFGWGPFADLNNLAVDRDEIPSKLAFGGHDLRVLDDQRACHSAASAARTS
jgi:hypothetical protein